VLVDGLWPRGFKKESLELDDWIKEIAPSPELRKWYGHKPERWEEFAKRYRTELKNPIRAAQLERLRELSESGTVTLLYAARDENRNNAVVIRDLLRQE
jgi:uncharacterized protein YeaO (DUF488 family)